MRRSYFGLVAAVAVIASGAASAAPTVEILGLQLNPNTTSNCGAGMSSQYLSGSVAEFNFDGVNGSQSVSCTGGITAGAGVDYGALGASSFSTTLGQISFSGTGRIVAGTESGVAGAPWADSSPYLVTEVTPDSETLDLSKLTTGATYFGLYWGSVDSGNVLTFGLSNGTQVSISGVDLGNAADSLSYNGANQTNQLTNVFVDFLATGGATIDSVTFTDSPNPAFEVDNLAFGNISVPEPISLSLFGIGLAGLGVIRRRKMKAPQ